MQDGMPAVVLTDDQTTVINAPMSGSLLLKGQAGTGKSTCAALRLRYLIESGAAGDSILVLVPQRSLAAPYYAQVHAADFPAGGQPSLLTFNGLSQRMIALFWPLINTSAGFTHTKAPFKFLTIESAQYYLAKIVEPVLQQGYFESLTIDPNRLFSQILDNLNKSAIVGFPPSEIAARLSNAWIGKPTQLKIYQQAEECAIRFRQFCLEHNYLDFSLQLSVFKEHIWPSLICKEFIYKNYQHLIYDNIEEDYPVAHDFVSDLLPGLTSALLIQDTGGGYRSFLGADPSSAARLGNICKGVYTLKDSFVKSPAIDNLENALDESIRTHRQPGGDHGKFSDSFSISSFRFYPEVIDWVVSRIQELLVDKAILPGEIAVLTPFLSDALRFSFASRLDAAKIPFTTHRPSRSLYNEPAVRTLLTLARIAHPSWGLLPGSQEVRMALALAIQELDYARADLLSRTLYQRGNRDWSLNAFDTLKIDMQERITYHAGQQYEILRNWLFENKESGTSELDHWLSRLYGEVLSQPGFGFHTDYDAAAAIAHLIDSCRKFRNIYTPDNLSVPGNPGKEYVQVLEHGILAAQSIVSQSRQSASNAVFLGPAFSFLMRNQPVSFQFWVDIGSQGWWSRLEQPLTQPYVLSRNWDPSKLWTDVEEYEINQQSLARLTSGLLRRCRDHVYMCSVAYNERGLEERGQLLLALQNIQRIKARQSEADNV